MRGADGVAGLIGAFYDAALDAELWPSVLAQFAQTFGTTKAHLAEDSLASTAGRLISYGADPVFADLYTQHYATCNVLWKNIVRRSLEGVLTDRAIMPREELVRSEFYNDFLKPQGNEELLCFVDMPRGGFCATLILAREQRFGTWGPKSMKALATVTPHMSRALAINRQIGDLRIVNEFADEALYRINCGLVLVGPGASVLYVNRAAEKLFEGRSLRIEQNRLMASRTSDTAALHRLVGETARSGIGGSVVIPCASGAVLLISAAPMKARGAKVSGVILFVREAGTPAAPNLTAFAGHFGLTAAEAATAAELIRADGVTAAATRLGLSRATVRTHLLHIFQKTATRRQAELVRLMLTWIEPLLQSSGR